MHNAGNPSKTKNKSELGKVSLQCTHDKKIIYRGIQDHQALIKMVMLHDWVAIQLGKGVFTSEKGEQRAHSIFNWHMRQWLGKDSIFYEGRIGFRKGLWERYIYSPPPWLVCSGQTGLQVLKEYKNLLTHEVHKFCLSSEIWDCQEPVPLLGALCPIGNMQNSLPQNLVVAATEM